VDFRVDPTGAPFIIDVNPNPYLTPDTEDAAAAAEGGLSYQNFIGIIVESSFGVSQVGARHASDDSAGRRRVSSGSADMRAGRSGFAPKLFKLAYF